MLDCKLKGRRAKTYKWAPRHNLISDDGVRSIRSLRASGMPLWVLAEQFNVGITTVSQIANRKRKAHVV